MPNYTCTHTTGPGQDPFTHTHAASQACSVNQEDSSCPAEFPLEGCVAIAPPAPPPQQSGGWVKWAIGGIITVVVIVVLVATG